MKKFLFVAIISAFTMVFAACGDDEEYSPEGEVCVVDFIPVEPSFHDVVMKVEKYSHLQSQMVDLSKVKIKDLLYHATESDFDELVLGTQFPVVVDFYADWCGPCKYIAPEVEKLAKLYPEIHFVKYDVDTDSFTVGSPCYDYGIKSIPTFKFFYLGTEYTKYGFTGSSVNFLKKNIPLFLDEVKGASGGN